MNDFETKLNLFAEGCQTIINNYYADNYRKLDVPVISSKAGKRYVKIIRTDSQTSVHCFIDKTNGDVLKAAGWKAPAKHARGNIFADDNGLKCMSPYGAAYLR